jgi:hypothetical protein
MIGSKQFKMDEDTGSWVPPYRGLQLQLTGYKKGNSSNLVTTAAMVGRRE